MISKAIEDYLKAIYHIQESGRHPSTNVIAERIGVAPASVTNMLKHLASMRLIVHTPYQGAELTELGSKVALEVIRHHRLLELYLTEHLGYSWDQVHDEAERLEHVISEEMEDRIDQALGRPSVDPHGDPIPNRELVVDEELSTPLSELLPGQQGVIARVSDRDPAMLRYLDDLGLVPSATVTVTDKAPFNGPIGVEVGNVRHTIGLELAANIRMSSVASLDEPAGSAVNNDAAR